MEHYRKKRRDTVHIRLSAEWHRQIKMKAARDSTTMAKILDQACKSYFERPDDGGVVDMLRDYEASFRGY